MKGMIPAMLFNVMKWILFALVMIALLFYGAEQLGGTSGPDIIANVVRSISLG